MEIRLSPYQEKWVTLYEEEAALLHSILGEEIVRIEHFGSTSIPGMWAKPVIDIICLVSNIEKVDSFNEQMAVIGYAAIGEYGIEGRRFFRKGGENRTHHLHIYQHDSKHILRHIAFRDYLKAHPDEQNIYIALKKELASQLDDTASYSKAKSSYVKSVEEKALAWWDQQSQ